MLGPFLKHVKVPPPDPDAPHIFRFAEECKLAGVLTSAGFQEVSVAKHKVSWPWPGRAEESWQASSEIAAPFKKMIAALPPEKREEVTQEVINGIRCFYDGQQINFPASLVSATAVRPRLSFSVPSRRAPLNAVFLTRFHAFQRHALDILATAFSRSMARRLERSHFWP
jgi:hypothetical protein